MGSDTPTPVGDRGGIVRLVDVLASPRRRAVLGEIHRRGSAHFDDLAAALAAAAGPLAEDERLRLRLEVEYVHVPDLRDADLVEYDAGRDVVLPTPTAELLFECAEQVRARDV